MSDWTQADPADCPDAEELLLASEGELPSRRLDAVREHVRRCTACRERLARTEQAIGLYGEVIAGTTGPQTIERPSAQRTIFRDTLRDEVATVQARRDARASRVVRARRWMRVAAAVPLLVLGLLLSSRYTQTVKAEELLTRAVRQEQTAPAALMRRVQIRMSSASTVITREIGGASRAAALRASAPGDRDRDRAALDANDEHRLAERLAANHFDLDDPLSVSRFQTWRSSLARKRDSVQSRQGARLLALTTTTDAGDLRSAQLVVRQADYHPVSQTLSFQDGGDVEIEEVAAWVVDAPKAADAVTHAAPARRIDASNAGRDAAPKKAAEAREAPLVIGLQTWRARTFGGGPVAESFGPDLMRLVDRLRARARKLDAQTRSQVANRRAGGGAPSAAPADGAPADAQVDAAYRDFMADLRIADRQLSLFLGSSTRKMAPAGAPSDLDARAPLMVGRSSALRDAVRALLQQEDVPMPSEMASPDEEPAALAAVRRALDDLWNVVLSDRSSVTETGKP